ncbi:DUF4097 family beta strand repeat-containing protein [Spirosoma montaniterrae]|uniref:DUF4097 family beta strand repeat-containing protein n=1 Tax=Spirosoma montaniterrae TaxID=1178516 RepID=UPI0012FA8E9C|nr:DUF4097 family beta strand repeat-containing protein [Spirosoma montaniterrae]
MFFFAALSSAQTPVQVVTKVVEKEIPYTDGQRIRLAAQKADIILKGWNRPAVSVKLRLVAKHPDRAVAEREVAYHQYTLQANQNEIELANRFVIPQRAGRLQGQLKAIYEVSVPARALLTITNSFGDLRLTDLLGDTNLKFEFGKLILEDIGGKLTVVSDYGDIDGRNLDAQLTLRAEKADVTLRDLAGRVNIKSRYGKLTLLPIPSLGSLTVEAARTDVLVATRRVSDFRYDVITTFADIRVPESVAGEVSKLGSKQTFTYQPPGTRKPEIQIQNSYGNVVIQGEKPLVDR